MKKWIVPSLVFIFTTSLSLYNIGDFPKMIGDEGIYVSQAYWLTKLGQLGPYTYWYDHFPLGWFQIGLWQSLVGPLAFFGHAVLTARILMSILLGGTSTLLYLLTHKISESRVYSSLAAFIFATSTLTLTFGRMVLLDNLAIFWFFLSLYVLFTNPTRLKNLAFSAIFLCLGILSKESLLFFLPPYLLSVYLLNRANPHRQYGLLVSFVTIFFFLSFFPLLALLKGEFTPKLGQVSFLETLLFQSQRGSGLPFWDPNSHFRTMLSVWVDIDPILVLVGGLATLALPLLRIKKQHKLISLFSLFFLLFLIRGGQIYDFYIIPLIPFLALNFALLLQHLSKQINNKLFTFIFILCLPLYLFIQSMYPFTTRATFSQLEAINALKMLNNDHTILAPNYAHLDVYLSGNKNIHWYDKSETDPLVTPLIPKVTQILVDEQFARDLSGEQLPRVATLIPSKMIPTQFGELQAPGQKFIPYTTELLNLYSLKKSNSSVSNLATLSNLDKNTLTTLSTAPPAGILINRTNFSSSTDLQEKLKLIRTILPTTKIFVSQDGEGNNTIPWISVDSRSFFKSEAEASAATLKKAEALKQLGFDGAIVASSDNIDGYLDTINAAAGDVFTALIRYSTTNNNILSNLNLVVSNKSDLEVIKNADYAGNLYLLDPL